MCVEQNSIFAYWHTGYAMLRDSVRWLRLLLPLLLLQGVYSQTPIGRWCQYEGFTGVPHSTSQACLGSDIPNGGIGQTSCTVGLRPPCPWVTVGGRTPSKQHKTIFDMFLNVRNFILCADRRLLVAGPTGVLDSRSIAAKLIATQPNQLQQLQCLWRAGCSGFYASCTCVQREPQCKW